MVRTHIRVSRSDGREFPNASIAFRELIGTITELSRREYIRMRPLLRGGAQFIDAHGFTWSSVGGTISEESILWSDFTFGVELELLAPVSLHDIREMLDTNLFGTWSVVPDGSLQSDIGFYAMEIVSPILQGEAGIFALTAVTNLLKAKGCRVNNSCGMHVHIGVRGMKPTRLRKIAVAFLNSEHNFDELVPPGRNVNRYCRSNQGVSLRQHEQLETATSVSMLGVCMNGGNSTQHYNNYRYHKLNFQSFVRHGTIEFRQHGGTVESEKAVAWVRLIAGFCAHAASQPQQTRTRVEFDAFLSGAIGDDAELNTYLRARRAKFSRTR